ncbi:MoaD/ThiS family protein [Glutamicibacter endophyticus]|uniref:MoaD/ThiS family protein n=1 Tax=Glutamicibacter sp. PS TaxID=3075634 RepID=UPI00283DBD2E|nr:MoaD/ThiS family protein [Glutamicibacter sp. PS]MDR4534296.1 MoaD/ThiS family protein [Glutamicibacter sp. PS]
MTEIQIRYFAAAAEAAGVEEERWPATNTLAELRTALSAKYGAAMTKVLRSGSFLVNGTVRRDDGALEAADGSAAITVDVLPPFAGG